MDNPETLATQGTQDEEKHNKNTARHVLEATFQNICTQEEFEDTKGVIRIRISKKNRQHNEHKLHPSATFYIHRLLFVNKCQTKPKAQSRDIGKIGHTRHRTKHKQNNNNTT